MVAMSEIKPINTGVAELLAVKVPEGAREFKVFNDERPYLSFFNGILTPRIYLPPGNWVPLGIDTELTEDDVWSLVDGSEDVGFKDYMTGENCWLNAFESFETMLQANGCYSVNPYGDSDATEIRVHKGQEEVGELLLNGFNRVRREADANTGTWLILKRLS